VSTPFGNFRRQRQSGRSLYRSCHAVRARPWIPPPQTPICTGGVVKKLPYCSRRHDAGAGEPGATRHYARRRTVGRRQPERHHLPLESDSNSAQVVRTITDTFEDRAARGSPVLAPGHWQARPRCPGLPAPLLLTTPGGLSCCFEWCLHQGDGAQPRSGLNHPVIGEMPILWPDALVEMTLPLPRLMVTWPEALVL